MHWRNWTTQESLSHILTALDSAILDYRMKLYYPAAKALGRSYFAIDSYSWSVDRDLDKIYPGSA